MMPLAQGNRQPRCPSGTANVCGTRVRPRRAAAPNDLPSFPLPPCPIYNTKASLPAHHQTHPDSTAAVQSHRERAREMEAPVLMADPSFREIISVHHSPYPISTVHSPYLYDDDLDGFEFADPPNTSSGDKAYPVFGRSLLHNDEAVRLPLQRPLVEASSPLKNCEVQGPTKVSHSAPTKVSHSALAPRTVPSSPERCRKSSSTGSLGRRCRLRDLVLGRSRSDGKEELAFLGSPEKESSSKLKEKKKGGKSTGAGAVTVHRAYYAKGDGGKAGRQSFLPYRPVLFGLFANRHHF